jgi:hypothetical protein
MCWCTYKLLEYNVWDQYYINSISKEFLDSKSMQNRIENQIGNSKLKTENRKENKIEKNRRRSLPDRSPATWPSSQPRPVTPSVGPTRETHRVIFNLPMVKQLTVELRAADDVKIRAAALQCL